MRFFCLIRSVKVANHSVAGISLLFLFLIVACARPAGGQDHAAFSGYRDVTPDHFGIAPGTLAALCNLDQMLVAPDGSRAFAYHTPTVSRAFDAALTSAAVFDVDCIRERGWEACPIDAIEALDKLVPLAWTADSRSLFLIEGNERLTALTARSGTDAILSPDSSAAVVREFGVTITPGAPASSRSAPALARRISRAWSQALADRPPNASVWSSRYNGADRVDVLYQHRTSLNLLWPSVTGERDTGVKSVWVQGVRLEVNAAGTLAIAGDGVFSVLGEEATVPPWQARPIRDPRTGQIDGFHDERRILRADFMPAPNHEQLALRPDEIILAAQRIPGGILAVVQQLSGATRWVVHTNDGPDNSASCGPGDDQGVETQIAYGRVGEDGASMVPYSLYRSLNPSKRLAIFFHGGPGSQQIFNSQSAFIRQFRSAGYDVLAPEYSGSTGAGPALAARLREGRVRAVQEDAKAIAQSDILKGYETIASVGSSFGAVGAIALEQQTSLIDCTILIGPYLRYRDPALWTKIDDRGGFPPRYQYLVDAAFFGDDIEADSTGFASQLRTMVTSWNPKGTAFAVFGADDVVSRSDDLPEASVMDRETVAGGHGLLGASLEQQRLVADRLRACGSAASSIN